MNYFITVDRDKMPLFPNFVKTLIYPQFQQKGPYEYDLRYTHKWLHPSQIRGCHPKGHELYAYLRTFDLLPYCFNLQDGLSILHKGPGVFNEVFGNDISVFLWASVGADKKGRFHVPYVYHSYRKQFYIGWNLLELNWDPKDLALMWIKK